MMFDLNGFQRDLLYVLASMDEPSGREVKARVEALLETTVTNGRLYPNLDELVERSYVDKGAIDRRTNYYAVTQSGLERLHERHEWERAMLAEAAAASNQQRSGETGRSAQFADGGLTTFPWGSARPDAHDSG